MTIKKNVGRTYVSLSFSCPPEMEQAINKRCVELGLDSRSDYLRRLFERDLAAAQLYDPSTLGRQAPPRIKRGVTKAKPNEPKKPIRRKQSRD